MSLYLELDEWGGVSSLRPHPRAIEDDDFPFESLSEIAEVESWRKEINRPTYHIHKWWAQRLGSVFRAMAIGTFTPSGCNVLELFYSPMRLEDVTVFDPFMGSGTTIGEALKLGSRAIGRDINPVAYFLVRNALAVHDRSAIIRTFNEIGRDVAEQIRSLYRVRLSDGQVADVLYYFWVKKVDCPACARAVDLFSTYVFARHAYPTRFPQAQAVCPACGEVNEVDYDTRSVQCVGCGIEFDPQVGPARGMKAICQECNHSFAVAQTVKVSGRPPCHRLYAKLVLMPDGRKKYLRATNQDVEDYQSAARALAERPDTFPIVSIDPGYNTNQVLGYNYRYWHEMFNARQLLSLSILADRIRNIGDLSLRELFTCLFSGVLEFNNLFASYKGEGTGAVRHMFSHHILKPERTPLEANVWGTPKSSGSFSTMFNGRIGRALDYADNPFELKVVNGGNRKATEKVFGLSEPLGFQIADSFSEFEEGKRVYLSCGDSSVTDLPDASVDAVITDPPFFDNVHYSQLADFFHVWQRHILGPEAGMEVGTTRSSAEVQNSDAAIFTNRLGTVLSEVHRVLKEEGLLVFTYHHSRPSGWRSILESLMRAGFWISATQPIKAEMSVAVPKLQAKEPINLDMIIVCRKRSWLLSHEVEVDPWTNALPRAKNQVDRMLGTGRLLSRNDIRVIITAQLLRPLSLLESAEVAIARLDSQADDIEHHIDQMQKLTGGEAS